MDALAGGPGRKKWEKSGTIIRKLTLFGMDHGGLLECDPSVIEHVLTAATSIHKGIGPGLLESVYQRALEVELESVGLSIAAQMAIPALWRGKDLGIGFRADLVVESMLLVEVKAVHEILPVHVAQVITYLKLLSLRRGYILNFNVPMMKEGIRRISI